MPMRSSPRTRRGLALICLAGAVVMATWNWHSQHRPGPEPVSPSLPAAADTSATLGHGAGAELADPPVDPVFGQQAQSPWLHRRVEMFQRDPASPGGRSQRWADHRLDVETSPSRDFPVASADFYAGVAQLDGRWLSHDAIRRLGEVRRLPPQSSRIPQNMLASFSLYGDYLVSSAEPSHPQPGDLRISWQALPWPPVAAARAVDREATAVSASAPTAAPAGWRPVAIYLLALVLLLIAAGLGLGWRRRG